MTIGTAPVIFVAVRIMTVVIALGIVVVIVTHAGRHCAHRPNLVGRNYTCGTNWGAHDVPNPTFPIGVS